jgi:hypothetical protein
MPRTGFIARGMMSLVVPRPAVGLDGQPAGACHTHWLRAGPGGVVQGMVWVVRPAISILSLFYLIIKPTIVQAHRKISPLAGPAFAFPSANLHIHGGDEFN